MSWTTSVAAPVVPLAGASRGTTSGRNNGQAVSRPYPVGVAYAKHAVCRNETRVPRARAVPKHGPDTVRRLAVSRHTFARLGRTSARGTRHTKCGAYAAPPPSAAGEDSDFVDWGGLFEKLKREKWDAPPKPWREFWATKVAAAVLEVDVETETVNAKEVEGIGLNTPKDKTEAVARLKHNLVIYRQNYAVAVWCASTLFAALANELALSLALVCFACSLVTKSDTLLGELSLATNNAGFTWNKTRVAGVDRASVHLVSKIACGVCVAAGPLLSGQWLGFLVGFLERFVFWGLVPCVAHAVLRPIDLKSTLTDLWNDAKGVQTKEQAAELARKGVKGMRTWWNNRRPSERTPVVMSVKGNPQEAAYRNAGASGAGGFNAQQQRRDDADEAARRRRKAQDDEGAVDAEGWTKPDTFGELPKGRK